MPRTQHNMCIHAFVASTKAACLWIIPYTSTRFISSNTAAQTHVVTVHVVIMHVVMMCVVMVCVIKHMYQHV